MPICFSYLIPLLVWCYVSFPGLCFLRLPTQILYTNTQVAFRFPRYFNIHSSYTRCFVFFFDSPLFVVVGIYSCVGLHVDVWYLWPNEQWFFWSDLIFAFIMVLVSLMFLLFPSVANTLFARLCVCDHLWHNLNIYSYIKSLFKCHLGRFFISDMLDLKLAMIHCSTSENTFSC